MPATASLRALLAGSVDYAGLFPPASLDLSPALANQAAYVRDPDVWMLGTFVLPVGKFEEASTHLAGFDVEHLLRISALGPRTENASEFHAALQALADAIRSFSLQHGAFTSISQIEMALPSQPGASVSETTEALLDLHIPTFWEAIPDEAERTLARLAELRAAGGPAFGFKLRTGGVVASAFPSSVQIARALVSAVEHRVPIKFTAGLHHPVRQFHSSVQAKMHGFLNVLGAGVLAAEHRWDFLQTAKMLEDENPDSFAFDDDRFSWTEWKIATDRISEHRKVVTSFGSCSFDEPRDDLRALGLL